MSNRMRFIVLFCICLLGASWVQAGEVITPQLADRMAQAESDELIRVYIVMERQADLTQLRAVTKGMNKAQKRQLVIDRLSELAEEDQAELLILLEREQAQGKVDEIRSLWLGNTICCKATREIIQRVATMRGVRTINWDKLQKVLHGTTSEVRKPARLKGLRKRSIARAGEVPTMVINITEDGVQSRSMRTTCGPWAIREMASSSATWTPA
jgi:hypothetical protein